VGKGITRQNQAALGCHLLQAYFSNALALVLYLTLLKYQAGLGIGYF
jgi:hypothetical protein